MIILNDEEKELARTCLIELSNYFEAELFSPVSQKLKNHLSSDLKELGTRLAGLRDRVDRPGDISLDDEDAPYVKLALSLRRRKVAEEQRLLLERTFHADIQKSIDELVVPINRFLVSTWLRDVQQFRLPPLSRFLTLKEVYHSMPSYSVSLEPHFDDKFAILQAHKCFRPMLARAREEAKLRDIDVTVAFVDIDNFKALNTALSETVVDRQVLPIVMQKVEAHVYSHGTAFKFGGDEYVLLLPNMGTKLARQFLFDLQHKISALSFAGVERALTVSIGLCTISSDSHLTDAEVLERANRAMRHAKTRKDCVSGFNDFTFEEMYIMSRQGINFGNNLSPVHQTVSNNA